SRWPLSKQRHCSAPLGVLLIPNRAEAELDQHLDSPGVSHARIELSRPHGFEIRRDVTGRRYGLVLRHPPQNQPSVLEKLSGRRKIGVTQCGELDSRSVQQLNVYREPAKAADV